MSEAHKAHTVISMQVKTTALTCLKTLLHGVI